MHMLTDSDLFESLQIFAVLWMQGLILLLVADFCPRAINDTACIKVSSSATTPKSAQCELGTHQYAESWSESGGELLLVPGLFGHTVHLTQTTVLAKSSFDV